MLLKHLIIKHIVFFLEMYSSITVNWY